MSGNPAEYTTAIVANSSIVALINEDVIQPLDDLLAAHGDGTSPNQLITNGGKVMAVAFMANAQHLVYRKDVLEQIGVEPLKTYEELLAAAEMTREQGIMENSVGGAYAASWNLAEELVNMYPGHGGAFYTPGTAEVSINNPKGVATLNVMKALTEYMNPDVLPHDSNATSAEWEAGNVALMNMWGSRTGVLMDEEGLEAVVYENTTVGGPMTVGGGTTPASTLWWDGWTVAKNISDEEAAATFIAMKTGVSPAILNDETMGQAVWMIDGYTSTWVASMGHLMGHLMGLFDTPWLGIPPTRKMVFLRYCEFNKVEHGKITETAMFFDIPHLMIQAGVNPFPPQTAAHCVQPGPQTHDGLLLDATDPDEAAKTHAAIDATITDIARWSGGQAEPLVDELRRSWCEEMVWWGPVGIGATDTVERYAEQHSGPFREAFHERTFNGHLCTIAEGHFGGFFGWPNLTLTHHGGFMGMPATGRPGEMRVIDMYRRRDDKLAENWIFIDLLHFWHMQGLEVLARTAQIDGTGCRD